MSIFISHAFSDEDQFDNIADALEAVKVPYWRPSEIVAGALLSDQLRDAISRSRACILIATRNSVDSSWCNAELGAFWGAGKRVFIYVADASLKVEKLPRQFQGHYLEKRISKLAQTCKEWLAELDSRTNGEDATDTSSGSQLTTAVLVELIESAIDRVTIRASAIGAFNQLGAVIQTLTSESIAQCRIDDDQSRGIHVALHQFLGLSRSAIEDVAAREWPYRVNVMTTSGRWEGYAKDHWEENENYLYSPCILLRFDENFRVLTVAFSTHVGDYNLHNMQVRTPVATAGRGDFGVVSGSGYVTDGT